MNLRVKIIISIIATLILGFVLGFYTQKKMIDKRVHHARQWDHPKFVTNKILDKLDLNDEQVKKIREIVETDMDRMRLQRKDHFKESRKQIRFMFEKIKKELDDEQVKELDRLHKKWMKKRRSKRKRKKMP